MNSFLLREAISTAFNNQNTIRIELPIIISVEYFYLLYYGTIENFQ